MFTCFRLPESINLSANATSENKLKKVDMTPILEMITSGAPIDASKVAGQDHEEPLYDRA